MSPSKHSQRDLKDILIEGKVASTEDIEQALREQAKQKQEIHLIDLLLQEKKCNEKNLVTVMNSRYGYTVANPLIFRIDPHVRKYIPKDIAEKHTCLPIALHENTLTIAMANPINFKAIDELRFVSKQRIRLAVTQYSILKECIHRCYEGLSPTEDAAGDKAEDLGDLAKLMKAEDSYEDKQKHTAELLEVAHQAPVVKLVNMIVLEGIRRRASDIFIEPWENFVRVRTRVDGLLEEVVTPHKSFASGLVSRIKIMSELNIAEHRVPQDGRFKVRIKGREVDMRVAIVPSCFGEKVGLRLLDTAAQSHDITKLGFSEKEQGIIKDSAMKPHGMILVTGPTGSGKTTTLYAVLKYLDSPRVNITTVEEPVEYQIPGINQVNVREAIGLTFPGALRSILRQDPDIILIGEIRDNETLDIAVKAALTGHLVLSTLHTNDAASSITRMVNLGLEPFLIASTVLMISAQRLVRKLCPRCRYSYDLEAEMFKRLNIEGGKRAKFWKAKGCAQCRQSGYIGRSVVTEILEMKPEILEMVMKKASGDDIKAKARQMGMNTLRESAIQKALEGETSLEEVFRVTTGD